MLAKAQAALTAPGRLGPESAEWKSAVREARKLTGQLMALGFNDPEIVERIRHGQQQQIGVVLSKNRIFKLCKQVRERWAREDEQNLSTHRAVAIARLDTIYRQSMMGERAEPTREQRAAGKPGTWIIPPDRRAAVIAERMLIRIRGLEAPRKVDINVHVQQKMVAVIANLSKEQVEGKIARMRELQRDAEAYRSLPPLPVRLVESDGDRSPSEKVGSGGE